MLINTGMPASTPNTKLDHQWSDQRYNKESYRPITLDWLCKSNKIYYDFWQSK